MIILETKEDLITVISNWQQSIIMDLEELQLSSGSLDEATAYHQAISRLETLPINIEYSINEDVMSSFSIVEREEEQEYYGY